MILSKVAAYFGISKKASGKTFFDYSSREKKKILKHAVAKGSKMQMDLIKKYENKYNLNKASI